MCDAQVIEYCGSLADHRVDQSGCAAVAFRRVHGAGNPFDWSSSQGLLPEDLKLCTQCPASPPDDKGWPTAQFAGCSSMDEYTCPWGSVCVRGPDVQANVCIKHAFGYGIEPFIALEGCSAINQQWIIRSGVIRSRYE